MDDLKKELDIVSINYFILTDISPWDFLLKKHFFLS
jgi:hypothetical protein